MRLIWIILAAATTACATTTASRSSFVRPVEEEAELLLQMTPFTDVAGLAFELGGASAVRADGTEIPLDVELPRLSASILSASRLFARGRLPPGDYVGVTLRVAKATLKGDRGPADLVVPERALLVEVGFHASARQGVVISIALQPSAAVIAGVNFEPQFSARIPALTVPGLVGLCTDPHRHVVAIFDKRGRELTGALLTGMGPWGVAIDSVRRRAYVALSGGDAVQIFDLQNGLPVGAIALAAGDEPRELALTADRRRLIVLNHRSNTVALLDPESMIELSRVDTVLAPQHLLVDPTGTRAYVTSGRNNQIGVIDVAQGAQLATLPTDDVPLRPQLDRDGTRLFVALETSPYVTVYSVPELAPVARVFVGMGISSLAVDPRTNLLYLGQRDAPRLLVHDAFSLVPVEALDAPAGVTWMAIDDAENTLFLLSSTRRELTVVDLGTRATLSAFEVGSEPRIVTLEGERR